jgi:hypothetical protein
MISGKSQYKKKQIELRHFLFLAFVNMAFSNLHALQAALLLLPERLSEVHHRAISRTPISVPIELRRDVFRGIHEV